MNFTDSEYAVIIDSLSFMRDNIRSTSDRPTPNIDSALAKFHSFARPSGCEFQVIPSTPQRNFPA